MKIQFPSDIQLHFMGVDTKWVNMVGDDGVYMLRALIQNGEFNKKHENEVTLRVDQENAEASALTHGGLLVMGNLKKNVLRKAILLGLHLLATNGALGPEDYTIGGEDGNPA